MLHLQVDPHSGVPVYRQMMDQVKYYIAAGTLKNTDENLAKWLHNPQAWKLGVLMPNLQLKDDEVAALVAFLRTQQ